MKNVIFFSSLDHQIDDDEFRNIIKKDISDWTELSDEEFKNLNSYKYNIEQNLKSKNILQWNEHLVVVRELSAVESDEIKADIKSIITSIALKEKAREEREKKRLEKLAKTAEQKKKEKELAQLKKLQEKYGGKN